MWNFYKNIKKTSYTKALLCLAFTVLCFTFFSFANNPLVSGMVFKTQEEITLGVNNQLKYLAAYNSNNENEGLSEKNWYVFVVGNDDFDETLLNPQYLHDYLDFSELDNVPISIKDITGVNNFLSEYNERLKAAGKPVIYYGIANKKVAINVPYFTNSSSSNSSETGIGDVYSFYNTIERAETSNEASLNIEDFFQSYFAEERASSISKIMSGIEGEAIVVLKYYYALTKSTEDGKASVKWYSIKDYELSENIKNTLQINDKNLAAQYKALERSQTNKNFRLIEAWYNYLTGRELPNIQDTSTDACVNLEGDAFNSKKAELSSIIKGENSRQIKISITSNCPEVIASLPYAELISGIRLLLADYLVLEAEEVAILKLIHAINLSDFKAFFEDLKDIENKLFNDLITSLDDRSTNPSDGNNFTLLIEELLRIGDENNGQYLKIERSYLLSVLLKDYEKISTEGVSKAINHVLTFNLDSSEDGFSKFLTQNNYRNLVRILSISIYTGTERESTGKALLGSLGESLGIFFAARNNQSVYKYLIDLAFNYNMENRQVDGRIGLLVGFNMLSKMFEHLPEDSSEIYSYLTKPELTKSHDLLMALHLAGNREFYEDYDSSITSYYKGLNELFNKYGTIDTRIELVKWAIDENSALNDLEVLAMNIFDNIPSSQDRNKVYKFLTGNEYNYLEKITINGLLSGEDEREIKFTKYYIGLINEHGKIEDRYQLLQQTIKKGDDWGWFWWHDTENIVSTLFTNLSYTDAVFLKEKLAENDYKVFKDIWNILESETTLAIFDKDNERFATFVTSFAKIFTITKEDMSVNLERYTPYLNENQNYLSNNVASIGQITDTYVPLTRADYANRVGGSNSYKLESSIDKSIGGSNIVSVNLKIGNRDIINDYYEPFEPIVIEFIEDMVINETVKFSKGDIVSVPAFYIPWLDGSIDAQQHTKAIWVTVDIVVFVASFAVLLSATSVAVIAAATLEIIFTLTDAVINIKGDELRADIGSEYVDIIEIVNLVWGLVDLPVMIKNLPKGLVKIKTLSGRVYESGIDAIRSIKGRIVEIGIDSKLLLKNIPAIYGKLNEINPQQLQQIKGRYAALEQKMARKMSSFLGNPTADFSLSYSVVKTFAYNLYMSRYSRILDMIDDFPNQFTHSFSDKILTVNSSDGEVLFKLDEYSDFTEFKVSGNNVTYDPNTSSNLSFKDGNATWYEDISILEKNGELVFSRVFMDKRLSKGSHHNFFNRNKPNHIGAIYDDLADVVDESLPLKKKIFVLERNVDGNSQEFLLAFDSDISSVDELRNAYPNLTIWDEANSNLSIGEYEVTVKLAVRRTVKRINGKDVNQFEFIDDAQDLKSHLKNSATSASKYAIATVPNNLTNVNTLSIRKGDNFFELYYEGYGVSQIKYHVKSEQELSILVNRLQGPDCSITVVERKALEDLKLKKGYVNNEENASHSGIYVSDELARRRLTWNQVIEDIETNVTHGVSREDIRWDVLFDNTELKAFKREIMDAVDGYNMRPERAFSEQMTLDEEALIRYASVKANKNRLENAANGNTSMSEFDQNLMKGLKTATDKLSSVAFPTSSSNEKLYKLVNYSKDQIESINIGDRISGSPFFTANYSDEASLILMMEQTHSSFFMINGRNGKLISGTAINQIEQETWFLSNSDFIVTNKETMIHPLSLMEDPSNNITNSNFSPQNADNPHIITVFLIEEVPKGGNVSGAGNQNMDAFEFYLPEAQFSDLPPKNPYSNNQNPVITESVAPTNVSDESYSPTMPPADATMPPADANASLSADNVVENVNNSLANQNTIPANATASLSADNVVENVNNSLANQNTIPAGADRSTLQSFENEPSSSISVAPGSNQSTTYPEPNGDTMPSPQKSVNEDAPMVHVEESQSEASTIFPEERNSSDQDQIGTIIPPEMENIPEPRITYTDMPPADNALETSNGSVNQTILPEANTDTNLSEVEIVDGYQSVPESSNSNFTSTPETIRNNNTNAPTVEAPPLYGNNNPTDVVPEAPPSPTTPASAVETVPAEAIVYPQPNGSTIPSPEAKPIENADLINNTENASPTNAPINEVDSPFLNAPPDAYQNNPTYSELIAGEFFNNAAKHVLKPRIYNLYKGKMILVEMASIAYYTRHGDQFINPALKGLNGAIITEKHRLYEEMLRTALNKLPKVNSETAYKGIRYEAGIRLREDMKTWVDGQVLVYKEFFSTTLSYEIAEMYASSNIIFEIENPIGVDITKLSLLDNSESEVLMNPNSEFLVLGKPIIHKGAAQNNEDLIIIKLRQLR